MALAWQALRCATPPSHQTTTTTRQLWLFHGHLLVVKGQTVREAPGLLLQLVATLVPLPADSSTAGLPQREACGEGERAEFGSEGNPRSPWSISLFLAFQKAAVRNKKRHKIATFQT